MMDKDARMVVRAVQERARTNKRLGLLIALIFALTTVGSAFNLSIHNDASKSVSCDIAVQQHAVLVAMKQVADNVERNGQLLERIAVVLHLPLGEPPPRIPPVVIPPLREECKP